MTEECYKCKELSKKVCNDRDNFCFCCNTCIDCCFCCNMCIDYCDCCDCRGCIEEEDWYASDITYELKEITDTKDIESLSKYIKKIKKEIPDVIDILEEDYDYITSFTRELIEDGNLGAIQVLYDEGLFIVDIEALFYEPGIDAIKSEKIIDFLCEISRKEGYEKESIQDYEHKTKFPKYDPDKPLPVSYSEFMDLCNKKADAYMIENLTNSGTLQFFINRGLNINHRGIEIEWCCCNLRILLKNNIDINIANEYAFDCSGGKDYFYQLVYYGIDVNMKDDKGIALIFHVIKNNNYDEYVIDYMIQKKCDIEVTDNNNQTPLFYAVKEKAIHIVDVLMSYGANIDHVDIYGKKPVDYLNEIEDQDEITLEIRELIT